MPKVMTGSPRLLFIHGLAGSSQGFKSIYLRKLYPDLVAPDFPGDVWERMAGCKRSSATRPVGR